MTMLPLIQCARCKHFRREVREKNVCEAFPDGIPTAIITGEHDHRERYHGDQGMRSELAPRWEDYAESPSTT